MKLENTYYVIIETKKSLLTEYKEIYIEIDSTDGDELVEDCGFIKIDNEDQIELMKEIIEIMEKQYYHHEDFGTKENERFLNEVWRINKKNEKLMRTKNNIANF